MAISLPDARLLSDDVLQALRLRALRGCELGFTEADVADLLGGSRETVSRWWWPTPRGDWTRCRRGGPGAPSAPDACCQTSRPATSEGPSTTTALKA